MLSISNYVLWYGPNVCSKLIESQENNGSCSWGTYTWEANNNVVIIMKQWKERKEQQANYCSNTFVSFNFTNSQVDDTTDQ
jgi:hypothetical protein